MKVGLRGIRLTPLAAGILISTTYKLTSHDSHCEESRCFTINFNGWIGALTNDKSIHVYTVTRCNHWLLLWDKLLIGKSSLFLCSKQITPITLQSYSRAQVEILYWWLLKVNVVKRCSSFIVRICEADDFLCQSRVLIKATIMVLNKCPIILIMAFFRI